VAVKHPETIATVPGWGAQAWLDCCCHLVNCQHICLVKDLGRTLTAADSGAALVGHIPHLVLSWLDSRSGEGSGHIQAVKECFQAKPSAAMIGSFRIAAKETMQINMKIALAQADCSMRTIHSGLFVIISKPIHFVNNPYA